jgi:hypothetical protein
MKRHCCFYGEAAASRQLEPDGVVIVDSLFGSRNRRYGSFRVVLVSFAVNQNESASWLCASYIWPAFGFWFPIAGTESD